ncbi:MAG: hypothetical protein EZS28_024878, partial [Streblomastix strix]
QLRFVGDGFNQKSSLNLSSCIFLLPTEYTFLKDGQHAVRASQQYIHNGR